MKPTVTVIIPVYGVENYIERCAKSLFEQSLDNIEYIFVNDCTPDNSIVVLQNVIEQYPTRKEFVKILNHKQNQGLPAARQTGLKVATGDYVIHCDSDDWVDLDLYESMYNTALENNLDVVCCDCKNTDGVNYTITKGGHLTDIDDCICDMMHRRMWWSLCNKIFRRSLYSNGIVFPKDAMGEDMCLCLQMFRSAKSVGYTPEKYYNYYINPNSIVNVWTPDQCLNKHGQLTRNLDIVKSCYQNAQDNRIKKGLTYLTFYAQEMLMPAVGVSKDIKKKWRTGLKGYCLPVILNNQVPVKQRIKAAMIFLHVFPRN